MFSDASDSTLIVFVDETGHEFFADPRFPIFGLGGCAIQASSYDAELRQPWTRFKKRWCGGATTAIHASEFGRAFPDAVVALADLFEKTRFFRFAATASSASDLWPTEILTYGFGRMAPVYEQITLVLRLRLKEILDTAVVPVTSIALIQESSERTNGLADRYFGLFVVAAPYQHVPVRLFRGTKAMVEPGLEIADFIAHTAGAQARLKLQGKKGWRRDFNAVFRSPDPHLTSYMNVDSVKWSPRQAEGGA